MWISGELRETSRRMSKKPSADGSAKSRSKSTRAERLAEVLRANLKRRKDGVRGRVDTEVRPADGPMSDASDD
jgi:hypothetical protein